MNPSRIKIAVGQYRAIAGNVSANCIALDKMASQAAGLGCQLILFPELADIGYDLSIVQTAGGTWPGRAFTAVGASAARHAIWICCGLSEKVDDLFYNAQAVFDPTGNLVAKYRKAHLFSIGSQVEQDVFSPGNELIVHSIAGVNAGLQICYDLRFPQSAQTCCLNGAKILLYSAAWPLARIEHWRTLLVARAIENQCFVAGATQWGTTAGLALGPCSMIVAPDGTVLASSESNQDIVITADIDMVLLENSRKAITVFGDRRPDLYR